MKGITGEEINGRGWAVGVIVWLFSMFWVAIMFMVDAQKSSEFDAGAGAVLIGICGIGFFFPAWIAASFASEFLQKK